MIDVLSTKFDNYKVQGGHKLKGICLLSQSQTQIFFKSKSISRSFHFVNSTSTLCKVSLCTPHKFLWLTLSLLDTVAASLLSDDT